MWEYLPARDASMQAIPAISKDIPESETAIGDYDLQDVLGYGQYAAVYASLAPDSTPVAVKAIDKSKLIDLVALQRVNSEIASLSDTALHHPGILRLKNVIHTREHLYLVTERGGKDLFDFFSNNPDGVPEDVVQRLIHHVAQAVDTLHRHNYCHRDLKPYEQLTALNSWVSADVRHVL